MNKLFVAGLAAIALACGSSSGKSGGPGGAQVNGTVGGMPFVARDALFNVGSWKFDFLGKTTAVQLSDFSNQCTYDDAHQQPPNTQTLMLVLSANDSSGNAQPANAVGDYLIQTDSITTPNALRAEAFYDFGGDRASGCFKTSSQMSAPSGGKVTLTSVSADRVEGTFDLTLEQGDHLTGSFSAPRCGTDCVPDADPQTPDCTGLDLNISPSCPPP